MKVDILIPCYNAERWIGQAIQSALDQSYACKEVIVVDDGSTDNSVDVIRSFSGEIRWESGPNRGGNAARNRLLELSSGEWLQYLDADDCLMPDKINEQMAFVGTNPETDVVYSPVIIEHISENASTRELLSIPEPHDPWILLARWYLPQTGGPIWRKQAIVDVGAWKPDQPCCQEHELYLRLLVNGKRFNYCSHAGAIYRQWGEHTVCKRDKPEVHRRRLEIERLAEQYLISTNQVTEERISAINQARFEIARMAWRYDRSFALRIMSTVQDSQPGYIPSGAAAPALYCAIYRLLGFRSAEHMAEWKRKLLGKG